MTLVLKVSICVKGSVHFKIIIHSHGSLTKLLVSSATDILYIGLSPTLSCIKTFSDPIFSFLVLPCFLLSRRKSFFFIHYIKAEKTSRLTNVWSKKRKENFHFEHVCKTFYCKRMILCNMRVDIRKCCKTLSKQFLVNVDKISFQ